MRSRGREWPEGKKETALCCLAGSARSASLDWSGKAEYASKSEGAADRPFTLISPSTHGRTTGRVLIDRSGLGHRRPADQRHCQHQCHQSELPIPYLAHVVSSYPMRFFVVQRLTSNTGRARMEEMWNNGGKSRDNGTASRWRSRDINHSDNHSSLFLPLSGQGTQGSG